MTLVGGFTANVAAGLVKIRGGWSWLVWAGLALFTVVALLLELARHRADRVASDEMTISNIHQHLIGHIPPRAQSYQHRAQLDKLGRMAAGDGASMLTQAVLTGMGGVGKTQIAADHARTVWDTGELDVLVWITANSRGSAVSGLAQAGVELCAADPEDAERAAAAFLAWLAPVPGSASPASTCRWMIVLDDLADPDDLRGLWPPLSPRGLTVVTTRRRDAALTGADRRPIEVNPFNDTEALNYLTSVLTAHNRAEPVPQLTTLASDLGHLPLALAQAAAYLVDAQVSCAQYRALLTDRTIMLRDAAPDRLPDEQALTVAAAWSLSIEYADTLRPPGLARPMLRIASLLDGHGIPGAVLTAEPIRAYLTQRPHGPATGPHGPEPVTVSIRDAHLALTALYRLSLLDDYAPNNLTATVHVHTLVQRATRDSIEPDQIAAAAHAAADALIAAWPRQEPDPDLSRALRANAAALIRGGGIALIDPDIHPVLFRVGESLSEAGSVEAAIRHFTRLLKHASRHLGADKRSVLVTRRWLATQHGQHGEVERAVDEMSRLLADQLRLLGSDDPETLTTRHELIWWQWAVGDRDGAERDLTTLLEDRVRIQGSDHPDTLDTRHNLYAAWVEGGRIPEALKAYSELLADRLRLQGPDQPNTIAVRHQIASLRNRISSDHASAIRDMDQVVQDRTRLQGADHPYTMSARQMLAEMHGKAADPKTAVRELEALYADRVRVEGADHPDTLTTRRLLAHWTAQAGFPDAALAMLNALLDTQRRVLGPDNPATLDTRHEIYTLWAQTDRVTEAREALTSLLSDRCRVQGSNHYDTQTTRQALDDITSPDSPGSRPAAPPNRRRP